MSKARGFLPLVLLLIMAFVITACSTAESTDNENTQPPETSAPVSDQSTPPPQDVQPKSVIDMFGREVMLPDKVETIATIGSAARMLTYAGVADMIVGVTEMDKQNVPGMPYSVVNAEHFAGLASVGSGGANNTTFAEELVTLAPDIIIGNLGDAAAIEDVAEKIGIPVIGIVVEDMFDDTFFQTLTLIGTVTGRSETVGAVIEYVEQCRDDLYNRTKDIPEEDKPAVYAGAVSFRGGHGITGTSAEYPPFAAINARNVVAEAGLTGFLSVDIEQIAVWDPDIIFLNPANMEMVEEDYAQNKAFFDSLSAVKNGKLFPQLPYNYNSSNIEIAIADAYYAGKIVYPDAFDDIDPVAKADEIFTVMLGQPFYDELAAVGYTFEPMTIGGSQR